MKTKDIMFAIGGIVTMIITAVTVAITKSVLVTLMLLFFATGFSSLFIALTMAIVIMIRDLDIQDSKNRIIITRNKYIAHNLELDFDKLYKKYHERYDNMDGNSHDV